MTLTRILGASALSALAAATVVSLTLISVAATIGVALHAAAPMLA
jgi:hypothetical protein